MALLTLGQARPAIALAAQMCVDDVRIADVVNWSINRLLPRGLWVGTVAQYRICTNAGCLTWPRQIQTIEAMAICNRPGTVRNSWFQFLEAGPGLSRGRGACDIGLTDMEGQFCSFDDITANSTTSYIRIYCDVPETAKYIILQGNDENGNWIRTQVSGTWIDGERVALPTDGATPVNTTKKFSSLARVIKDATNGVVRLYEWDGSAIVKSLAIYEPDELTPCYRRSRVNGLNRQVGNTTCDKSSVTVMAKKSFYKVSDDNDFLLLGCLPALEEAARSKGMFEAHLWAEAYACEARALKYLDDELASYNGTGAVLTMRVQMDNYGAWDVENAVGEGMGWWNNGY